VPLDSELCAVAGELPRQGADRQIGDLVGEDGVGEALVFDPDAIRFPSLARLAAAAAFVVQSRLGPRVAYFARLGSTANR
jgi:hypothetical protein